MVILDVYVKLWKIKTNSNYFLLTNTLRGAFLVMVLITGKYTPTLRKKEVFGVIVVTMQQQRKFPHKTKTP